MGGGLASDAAGKVAPEGVGDLRRGGSGAQRTGGSWRIGDQPPMVKLALGAGAVAQQTRRANGPGRASSVSPPTKEGSTKVATYRIVAKRSLPLGSWGNALAAGAASRGPGPGGAGDARSAGADKTCKDREAPLPGGVLAF